MQDAGQATTRNPHMHGSAVAVVVGPPREMSPSGHSRVVGVGDDALATAVDAQSFARTWSPRMS
jgi:hypothetical protein